MDNLVKKELDLGEGLQEADGVIRRGRAALEIVEPLELLLRRRGHEGLGTFHGSYALYALVSALDRCNGREARCIF